MPSSCTILIIDNDDGLVAALATRLEHYGYNCIRASTGAQGVAAFEEHRVDLVITDLNMPGGNGIELAKAVRKVSHVPIVFVTGFRGHFGRELRTIPNVSVLEKPFSVERLMEIVEADLVLNGRSVPFPPRPKAARHRDAC